jgi:molybdenum cofactor cytidylyltransferase
MKFAAIILAAGFSSRMGEFKPLMQLGDKTLLGHCAAAFRQAKIRTIVVVTGHRHPEVEALARRLDLRCIHNPDHAQGMYSSIRTAVRRLPKVDGFFLLPVDIPLVRPATLAALAAAFDGKTVVLPQFAGASGHPPLLPVHLIPAILAHDGQGGLQALLKSRKAKEIKTLPVWDKGILLDADTPEDFAVLADRLPRLAIGERAEALALAGLLLPEKGLAHGLAVARVAEALGLELNHHGVDLDGDILHNCALLHDIAKGSHRHEAAGAKVLVGLGLGRLAEIVAAHKDTLPPASGLLSEKEVVCLADKLVRGQYRVPVRRRFLEKLELYADNKAACRAIETRMANALALQDMAEKVTGKSIETILGDLTRQTTSENQQH